MSNKTQYTNCQCLVRLPDYIDAEMIQQGYSNDTHWFYERGICGASSTNEFAQGHDAKEKSELIKAFRAGVEVDILDGGVLISTDAWTVAAGRGWERFLTPAKPKSSRRSAKAKAETASKLATADAMQVTVDEAIEAMKAIEVGTKVRVKVGRWVKEGTLAKFDDKGMTAIVNYKDGSGETRSVTKPVAELEAI